MQNISRVWSWQFGPTVEPMLTRISMEKGGVFDRGHGPWIPKKGGGKIRAKVNGKRINFSLGD